MKLTLAAQRFLGLIFIVFGLNGFFHFITPPPMSPPAMRFIADLISTGYMLPLWKGTEVVTGILLFADIWSPLALILLAPVLVNIVAFHVVLDPRNIYIAMVLLGLAVLTAWRHRAVYAPLFRPGT